MHAPKQSGSQDPQNHGQAILLAVGAIVAVIGFLAVRDWLNSLSPLAGKLAWVGVISTLVCAGSIAFGYFVACDPTRKTSLLQTKAETEIGSQVMLWSGIIALVCFVGVAAIGEFESKVNPQLKEAFFFNSK